MSPKRRFAPIWAPCANWSQEAGSSGRGWGCFPPREPGPFFSNCCRAWPRRVAFACHFFTWTICRLPVNWAFSDGRPTDCTTSPTTRPTIATRRVASCWPATYANVARKADVFLISCPGRMPTRRNWRPRNRLSGNFTCFAVRWPVSSPGDRSRQTSGNEKRSVWGVVFSLGRIAMRRRSCGPSGVFSFASAPSSDAANCWSCEIFSDD